MAPLNHLPLRKVGKDGPLASVPALGLMSMSPAFGVAPPDAERLAFLDRAWELGCVNWDTADKYGDVEELIGKWFKLHPERRADVFLATKFGLTYVPDPNGGFPKLGINCAPEYVRQACERSLSRLGVECIDLFYLHRVDPTVPIEKSMEVMAQLQKEGKIKHIGICAPSSSTLRRACAVAHVAAVQVEYSPWTLDIENEAGSNLLKTCRELGVAIFTYSPLGKGMLTGQVRSRDDLPPKDVRRFMPRFDEENFAKNLALVEQFKTIAAKKGCTPGQLAMAWVMAQGDDIFPIPGTKTIKYLEENVVAAAVTLSGDELAELRAFVDGAVVAGEQIPTQGPIRNYGDTPAL